MRNIFIFIVLLFSTSTELFAQCSGCPPIFTVKDNIRCTTMDLFPATPPQPYGYTNPDSILIKACKNSTDTYTFDAAPMAQCFFVINVDSVVVQGGTLISFTNNSVTVTWSGASTGSILINFHTITGATLQNCTSSIFLKFSLQNNPNANFTISPNPACFNNPTTINFGNTTVGGNSYLWNFGDGQTSTDINPVHNYTAPGSYQICLIATNIYIGKPGATLNADCPACRDTICQQLIIDSLPAPEINCVSTVCAGETSTYCTNATGCTGYAWSVTGGVINSGNGTSCIQVSWGSGVPQGTVSLVATGCTSSFCSQGNTVTVPIVPSAAIITGNNLVCVGNIETYTLPTLPGTGNVWTTTGGIILGDNSNTNAFTVNWDTVGTYLITCNYTDTLLGCGGVATFIVQVAPILKINGPITRCVNQVGNYLSNHGIANVPVSSTWSTSPATATITGNGTPNAGITFTAAGMYTITAVPVVPTSVCNTATYSVNVLPLPIISAILGGDSICPNSMIKYNGISTANGLFTWSVTGGSFVSLAPNNDSVNITWNPTGPYGISLSQVSNPGNCTSNTFNKSIKLYPAPIISGPINVCADDTKTYTITNILTAPFNWFITPATFGNVVSGQGTNTVQINWNGNNSPGSTNTVYLHYGVCGNDSIAINITDPPNLTINSAGTLCPGGINLTTIGTGTKAWTCAEHPIVPTQATNTNNLTGLYLGGHYTIVISNYNNTGCNVSSTINVPNVGRPKAQIYAAGPSVYCLPTTPSMTMNAVTQIGYTYQWFMNNTPVGTGPTLNVTSGPPCNITLAGTYIFKLVVTFNGCTDTSVTHTVSVLSGCPANNGTNPGCGASFAITSISACNPFTNTIAATAPAGSSIVAASETITHKDDNSVLAGLTTKSYTTVGVKQYTICATVLLPSTATCSVCKDTFALVDAAANFSFSDSCGIIKFTNLSQVYAPNTITGYSWFVGDYPANSPVPGPIASFNNTSIANPILTVTIADTFIVTHTISTSSGCSSIFRDTIITNVPNADFVTSPNCVGTSIAFSSANTFPSHYWNFGDASSGYTNPTMHAYALASTYSVQHIVTDNLGCIDTSIQNQVINPTSNCPLTYVGLLTFCSTDSLTLNACAGSTSYTWYKNNVIITGATASSYTVHTAGNYNCISLDINGCKIFSDTVTIVTIPAPNPAIITSGKFCEFEMFNFSVASCAGCLYFFSVDGIPQAPSGNVFTGFGGSSPFLAGPHTVSVIVADPGTGCSATDSVTFIINPQPTIISSVLGSPTMMCSGNNYTMVASTNSTNPIWAWTLSSNVVSTNDTIVASAAGFYTVTITDGTTGCSNQAFQNIDASPNLSLFPIGCDSICDTAKISIPLPNFGNDLSGYTSIKWYEHPNLITPIDSGVTVPLNILTLGNHMLTVIVKGANGCEDTAKVYNLTIFSCVFPLGFSDIKLSLQAYKDHNNLFWQTNMEEDVRSFEILKSNDGVMFTKIAELNSKGNNPRPTHYSNTDYDIETGRQYYRIKMKWLDGQEKLSDVQSVQRSKDFSSQIFVYPNPGKDKINIDYTLTEGGDCQFNLLDMTGRLINQSATKGITGTNHLEINVAPLASGLYFIQYIRQGEFIETFKIRKED